MTCAACHHPTVDVTVESCRNHPPYDPHVWRLCTDCAVTVEQAIRDVITTTRPRKETA